MMANGKGQRAKWGVVVLAWLAVLGFAGARAWADTVVPSLGVFTNINSAPWPGIYITNSGVAQADTSYGLKSSAGGLFVYTNTFGWGVVYDVSGSGGLTGNAENVDITNAAGQVKFLAAGGAFPATGFWLTNNPPSYDPVSINAGFTNVFGPRQYIALRGNALLATNPVVSRAWYVSPSGSDALGARGRPDLPLQTIAGLLRVMTTNDTAFFAPGTYADTNTFLSNYHFPPGASLVGAGRGVTVIGLPGNWVDLYMQGTNVVLSNFSLWGSVNSGSLGQDQPLVNAYFDKLQQWGRIDGVYMHYWETPLTMRDCTFGSVYDALVLTQAGRLGYSNSTATAYNCIFKVGPSPVDPTPADGEPIVISNQRFDMYGGSLILESSNTAHAYLIGDVSSALDSTNGLYRFFGVNLNVVNTNGTAWVLHNSYKTAVQFRSMLVNSNLVYSPTGPVDYGYTWMSLTNGATVKSVPGF